MARPKMSVWNGWRVATLCLVAIGTIAMGQAQTVGSKQINAALTSNGDGAERSKEIHWPNGFHPEQADLFAHNEIVVHASCQKVFANIVDAQAWPEWYPNSHNVKVLNSPDGKLHEGTRFSWDTFGVHIESRVHEFVPNSRIGWFGDGTGMHAYHTFLLLGTNEGCHIVTEEVVKGPGAVEFREKQPNVMHEGHDLWLRSLKQCSEP
jgi:Polyketide cyclase / dehydrase and lipid transport